MIQLRPRLVVLLAVVSLAGCGVADASIDPGAPGDGLAEASAGLSDDNGLDYNGCGASSVDSNGLDRNGLDRNGLDRNGLDRNGLLANTINPTVATTFKTWFNGNAVLNEKVMKYFVKCAVPAGTNIHWTNPNTGVSYTWGGKLGLAPNWASVTPTATDKAWVSACMLAHINAKATPYMVSFRSPAAPSAALAYNAAESTAYNVREGAFWGNLFGPTIVKNACYQLADGVCRSKTLSDGNSGRSCAAANLNCGLNITGDCSTLCVKGAVAATDGYASCSGTAQVITTFIAPFCGDGSCNAAGGENATNCFFDCRTTCPGGGGNK